MNSKIETPVIPAVLEVSLVVCVVTQLSGQVLRMCFVVGFLLEWIIWEGVSNVLPVSFTCGEEKKFETHIKIMQSSTTMAHTTAIAQALAKCQQQLEM